MMRQVIALLVGFLWTTGAVGAGVNVDLHRGDDNSGTPSDIYAAAATQAGRWNAVDVQDVGPWDLLDSSGAASGVTLLLPRTAGGRVNDDPGTSGDDEALLDDGFNTADGVGISTVFAFGGLPEGSYAVFTYAWDPNSTTDRSLDVEVNGLPPVLVAPVNDVFVGFGLGETHAVHQLDLDPGEDLVVTVTTVDDVFDSSTINGMQIVPVEVPEPAHALLLATGALVLLGAGASLSRGPAPTARPRGHQGHFGHHLVREPRFHPALLFLLSTGARRGEALGLKWSDVDFDRSRLHIRRAIVRGEETTPKNGRGRTVAMSPGLASTLLDLLGQRRAQALGRGWPETPEWVFCAETGGPLDSNNFERSWLRLRRRAQKQGVRPLKLHCARHTWASMALASGKSVRWVADQLGHSSPMLTLKTYAHALPEEEADLSFADFETGSDSKRLYPSPTSDSDVGDLRNYAQMLAPRGGIEPPTRCLEGPPDDEK